MTTEEVIKEIQELKVKLIDRESECLRMIGDRATDYYGDRMREIVELRAQQALLDRTIEMLKKEN